MRSFVPIAWLLAALPALAVADDTYYTGDGTAYTLSEVSSGNCNFMYDPGVGENYAALNNDQWDSTMNCGRCAEVSCDDDACSDTTSTVTVYIVDRCPECSEGDLDLSPTVFETLTGSSPSRYSIKWKFVDCPVSGNLQYCTKTGSSDSWLAIQPANMVEGVASMTIASQEVTMVDSAYYFLLSGGSSVDITSVTVEVTSVSGTTVTETLSLTSDSCTEGSSNFAGGSSSQTSTTTTTSSPATTTSTPTTTTATPTSTPTATTAAPTSTPTPTTATPTPSTSTGSSSTSQTETQSSEAGQVSNDFDSLTTDGSSNDSTLPGTVSAADDSSSGVSILQSSETGVDNTPSTQDDSDTTTTAASSSTGSDDSTQANTESGTSASGTSTIIIVLVVCAAVGGIALAAVAFMVKKKKMDDKRNDRDDAAMLRSFDTFSSPVRITSTIAQI